MNAIFLLTVNIIDVFIVSLFLNMITKSHDSLKSKGSMILLIIIMTLINLIETKTLNYVCFFIVVYIIARMIYKVELKSALIFAMLYNIIASTSEMITFFLLNYIYKDPLNTLIGPIIFIIMNALLKSSFIFAYLPFKCLIKDKIFFKSIIPVMILPIAFIILIFGILQSFDVINIYIKISVILLFFSNFIILYALFKVNESERLKMELNEQVIKEELNGIYYKLIEQKYNANRRYVHDFNKHVNILNTLLRDKRYDEMEEYLKSMFEVSMNLSNQICSGNKSLDLVLSNINEKLDTSKIKFIFEEIEDINFNYEDLYDLITILYNAIENAVESCLDGGTIFISFKRNDTNYIILRIINTSSKEKDEILKSYKDNQEFHGIGIMSIKEAVKVLHGRINFSYDKESNQFKIIIILPYNLDLAMNEK